MGRKDGHQENTNRDVEKSVPKRRPGFFAVKKKTNNKGPGADRTPKKKWGRRTNLACGPWNAWHETWKTCEGDA